MDVVERAVDRFPPGTVELWLFGPDDDLDIELTRRLSARRWRCVMIGQGVRVGVVPTETFERIVNLIRLHAPDAAIAFNESIYDGREAASRWVDELAMKNT
ncbi:hypothetical protein DT076_06510 [Desertihabitans brevis]|uniref:STAS/SEC14 domain-containing protein n=2 Tax=Desertihabitans brevis TaxID=2268447 RepID=A0A367YWM6_9ACTN|nr:hypothetical protein DT076_06510 [Desertihabitans brevis]